jgi:hypothetical protein
VANVNWLILLIALVVLVMIPGGASASVLSDTSASLADSNIPDNTITTTTVDDSVCVAFASLETNTTALPAGERGDPYSAILEATPNKPPYTWQATGLPAGLTCSAAGVISGTPTGVGDFTVTVTVTDALANSDSKDLTLKISCQLGHANMDGIVDAGDITNVKRIYFGLDAPTPRADVNGDGFIDAGDITAIKVIYNWLSGYSYRKQITIDGSSAGAQTNYQMDLSVYQNYGPIANNGNCLPNYVGVYPGAYYYNGKTYIVWQGVALDPYIDCYDHPTGTWHGPVKIGTNPLGDDAHGGPSVIVDDSGYIHVFYGCHGTAVKHAKSTNTEDISSWTAQSDIGSVVTYPQPINDSSGTLWLFTRETVDAEEYYRKSTDWATPYEIIETDNTDDVIYAGNPEYDAGNGRAHLIWTYRDATVGKNINLYHAYLELSDGHMYSMAGTNLGTSINLSEADAYCKIVSYTSDWVNYRNRVHIDGNGYPHVIYMRLEASNGWHAYCLAWNGSAWDSQVEIAHNLESTAPDFYVSSASSIDAYLIDHSKNLKRWHWNGSTWTSAARIIDGTVVPSDRRTGGTAIVVNGQAALRAIAGEARYENYAASDLAVYAISSSDTFVNGYGQVGLNGHCEDDFDDIDFTKSDGNSELDYWLQSKTDGYRANFWVEFDSIPADPGSGTFYLYYGNSGATSSSDGDDTFTFFDDFSGSIDWTNKWYATNQSPYSIVDGWLRAEKPNTNTEFIRTKHSFGENKAIYLEYRPSDTSSYLDYISWGDGSDKYSCANAGVVSWPHNTYGHRCRYIDSSGNWQTNSGGWTTTLPKEVVLKDYSDCVLSEVSANGAIEKYIEASDPRTGYDRYFKLLAFKGAGKYAEIDNVRIRNFCNPEPTWGAWGSEESPTTTNSLSSKRVGIGDTFTVDMLVNPDTGIAGAQFSLNFNPSVVTANGVTEGNLLKQGGAATFFLAGTIDNLAGTITNVAGVVITPGASVSTPGTFATISFTATTEGTSTLDLSNVIVTDKQGQAVAITVTDGSVTVCPDWDVNLDLSINVLEMALVGQHWGETGAAHWIREDVNRNGEINVLDMILIGQHWTG